MEWIFVAPIFPDPLETAHIVRIVTVSRSRCISNICLQMIEHTL